MYINKELKGEYWMEWCERLYLVREKVSGDIERDGRRYITRENIIKEMLRLLYIYIYIYIYIYEREIVKWREWIEGMQDRVRNIIFTYLKEIY